MKLLEILLAYNKVTTVFQKYPWKCAVDPLITLEIPFNFLIWDVWEPCIMGTMLYLDHQEISEENEIGNVITTLDSVDWHL